MKKFYTEYKVPIAAILIFILLGGVYSYQKIKTSLFPNITFPKIKIIVDNGEQPIDKMMITVTVPLENAVKKVQDLRIIRSTTSRGSSEISAFFDWGADIDLSKQRIEARISEIKQDLPSGVNITIEKMNPSILPVMGFSLEGKNQSQIELRKLAQYTVKPFLSKVNGVSQIAVTGGKIKEYQIYLNDGKLTELGLTPKSIYDALNNSNFIQSNGYIRTFHRLYLSITDASIKNLSELENLIVLNNSKRAVRLKDIAEVKIGSLKQYIKINANGKDVPLIAVLKQPDANLISVTNKLNQQIKKLSSVLPKGVKLVPFYNQADFVNTSISSIRDVLWVGLLLAIIVTILFLRSFKASSVLLITIPITLSLTFIVLFSMHYTLNIMTIGAIAAAIGLIIDDAIVVVEQIHKTHEELPEESTLSLVVKSINYLLPAMIGSSLSTIVIFLPFVLMSGVAGAYFKVMTDTMIITLLCSFFVTWLGLPVIYLVLTKEKEKHKIIHKELKKRNWVYFFIKKPVFAIVFVLILITADIIIPPRMPSGFLPEMDEGSIVLDYKSPPGTSLQETNNMLKIVDKIVKTTPEVSSFSRRTGTQLGFFITEPNNGDYLIQLKKNRSKSTVQVSDEIRKKIEAKLPMLTVDFGQVITDMLGDLMTSVQPIEIKIFGDDINTLHKISKQVSSLVDKVKGTADVFDGIVIAGPEIRIIPNNFKLAQVNLTPQDFWFQIKTKLRGEQAGSIIEKVKLTGIKLFQKENKNLSVSQLNQSPIFLPNGKILPLEDFAEVKLIKGVAEIDRENLKPMAAVTARLNERDLGSTLNDIQNVINKKIHLPGGYQIEYGGAYAQQQKAFSELLIILITASFLVFTVMLFLFKNIKAALAIIVLSVLGTAGSFLALFITATPLNVGSYIGIIMIIGIIGENSIFTFYQYKKERIKHGRNEAVMLAVSNRLRPNLMTALGAIFALLPLALGIGAGAQMHQPLAVAVIGGFIMALPLLFVVLPTFIKIIEK